MTALQRSLPKGAYVDAGFYQREQRHIFWDQWVYAGRAESWSEPASFSVLDVSGESIIVVRGRDGELHAHVNLCRHRGSRLLCGEGTLRGAIRCPYHGWAYDADGSLAAAPFVPFEEIPESSKRLHPVRVADWGGFVFVHLTPEHADAPGGSLADHLGRIPARLARYPLADLQIAR